MSETQHAAAAPEAGANPLLKPWQTPFETPPFAEIEPEHFLPAFERAFADEDSGRKKPQAQGERRGIDLRTL